MTKEWRKSPLKTLTLAIADGSHNPPKGGTLSSYLMLSSKNVFDDSLNYDDPRYLTKNQFVEEDRRTGVVAGDVLLTIVGTIGRAAVVPPDAPALTFQRSVAVIRPNPEILQPRFLMYALHATSNNLCALARGVAQKGVYLGTLRELEIGVPPIGEQKRIVAILDQAFEAIDTAKANTARNRQKADALFQSYLQAKFSENNERWVEQKIGDDSLLEIVDGDRGINYPKSSDFHDQGYCLFLNTKNVRPDGFSFESTMFITEKKDKQLRKGHLKRGDVVLTTRGTIGNIGLYDDDVPFENVRINSGMLILRPNPNVLLPSFLFELLRSDIVKNQITKQTTGAAQPQLPIKTLVDFTIPIPIHIEDQRDLVMRIGAYEPKTQQLESIYDQKTSALEALRESLLHDAFTACL